MIKVFKMINGEDLISESTGCVDGEFTLENPASIIMQQIEKGMEISSPSSQISLAFNSGIAYNSYMMMNYTLITKVGKVYTFYVRELAETYQISHGGVIIDPTASKVSQDIACL